MSGASPVRHYRAKVASLTRSRSDEDPDLVKARRHLHEARLADQIKRTVDSAPPLTRDQRDRLARLLLGGDAA